MGTVGLVLARDGVCQVSAPFHRIFFFLCRFCTFPPRRRSFNLTCTGNCSAERENEILKRVKIAGGERCEVDLFSRLLSIYTE